MSPRAATVFVGAILLWLAAPVAALADEPCAPLDVTCVLDELIDPEPEPDPGPLDETTDPVDDVVDEVGDRVDLVLDDVGKVVDDLLGRGGIVDPPVGGGDDGGGGDNGVGPGTGGPHTDRADPRAPVHRAGVVTTASREGGTVTDIATAASGSRKTPVRSAFPPGGIVQAAITGALLLLGLFLVTVAFLLLQDRLDRGDPKLAIAPVRAETVTFE